MLENIETYEIINEIARKTNVSYEEAKDVFEATHGNKNEAISIIERNKRTNKINEKIKKGAEKGSEVLQNAINKGNEKRLIISRNGSQLINIPLTIAIIIGIVGCEIIIPAAIVSLFLDCSYSIEDKEQYKPVENSFVSTTYNSTNSVNLNK